MLQYSLLCVALTVIVAVKCSTDASKNDAFTCKSKFGAFADKEDCSKFWLCLSGKAYEKYCDKGKHFSENLGDCVKPEQAKCESEKFTTSTAATTETANDVKLVRSRRAVKMPTISEAVTAIRNLFTNDETTTHALTTTNDHNEKVTETETVGTSAATSADYESKPAENKKEKSGSKTLDANDATDASSLITETETIATTEKISDSESKAEKESKKDENEPKPIVDAVDDASLATEKSIIATSEATISDSKSNAKDKRKQEKNEPKPIDVHAAVDVSSLVTELLNSDSTETVTEEMKETTAAQPANTEEPSKIINDLDVNKNVIVDVDANDKKSSKDERAKNHSEKKEKKVKEEEQLEVGSTEKQEQGSTDASEEKSSTGIEEKNTLPPTEESVPEAAFRKQSKGTEQPINEEPSTEKVESESSNDDHSEIASIENFAIEDINENVTKIENGTTKTVELPFACPTPHGMFPHTKSCRLFFKCANNIPYTMICPGRLEWNAPGNICDWPELAKCAVDKRKPKKQPINQ